MRLVPLCLAAALAACAPPTPSVVHTTTPAVELTAEQVAARAREREFAQRRFALAATSIDDPPALSAALRQTAEWSLGPATEDRSPAARREREAAVVAEVARLRPIVEDAAQTMRISRAAYATTQRDQQAEIICRARGQLRDQALPYRGLLNLDNAIAGMQAARICMDTYRATGILPGY